MRRDVPYAVFVGKVRDQKNKASAEGVRRQLDRRRTLAEVRMEAAEYTRGLRRGQDPAEAIQMVLDNMTSAYEYATQQVMSLEETEYWIEVLGGKRLNHWIVEQERLGLQIVHVAGKAAGLGLAERQVRLQEQQAAIFAMFVEAALVEAGIDAERRRQVHQGLANRLEDIEGTAVELTALPVRAA